MTDNKTTDKNNTVEKKSLFSISLNIAALAILVAIIAVFIFGAFTFIYHNTPKQTPIITPINFKLDVIQLKKTDTTLVKVNKLFIDSLNTKVSQLKEQIESLNKTKEYIDYIQSRNENDFRLLLIILGAVFAIVGFFGFKSINDVRENTIKNAKEEALKIAEKETERIAEKVAKTVASETAKTTSETETTKYLEANKGDLLKITEKNLTEKFNEQISGFNDRLDRVSNPFSFNPDERPRVFNLIEEKYLETNKELEKLKNEIEELKNDSFKSLIVKEITDKLNKKQ